MTEHARAHVTRPAPRAGFGLRRIRVGAAIAVAVLIGFGAWLAFRGGSSSSTSPVPKGSTAVPISVDGLKTIATVVGIPIYWVGEKPGFTYELTKTTDNRVFIRYLPAGVRVGSDTPYLTIGTYPVNDAFAATSRIAGKSGATTIDIGKGGVAVSTQKTPTSVYVAYRGSDSQIEVYDPTPGRARELVTSGQVAAVR
jgi:hypothetical protein